MSVFVIIPTRLALTPAFRFDDQSHVVHLYLPIELVDLQTIFSGSSTWLNQVTAVFMGAISFGIVDFRSFCQLANTAECGAFGGQIKLWTRTNTQWSVWRGLSRSTRVDPFAGGYMSIWTILFAVLLIAWITGFSVFHVAGGLIHLLLVLAVISLIIHFVAGARTA
jgi:hypothetical protein